MNAIIIQTTTMITCTTNCMLSISCKSSTICFSLGILIVNKGGNVLLIEFALVEGMPELLMFIVINAVSHGDCSVIYLNIKLHCDDVQYNLIEGIVSSEGAISSLWHISTVGISLA